MKQQVGKNAVLLVVLHLFLGSSAFISGAIMIINPSGSWMQLPLSLLDNSPFPNYFIPGLILFTILGVLPLLVASALLKKWNWRFAERFNVFQDKHWSWTFSLYIGFALIIWIAVQIFVIQELSILQLIYFILGLIIQMVTLLPITQDKYIKIKKGDGHR